MNTIHVAGGVGVADTAMASYDAALADANLHNYNLVAVSSVVPAEATVEAVPEAPDLGPAGNRLTVVEARRTIGPGDEVDFREGGRSGAEDAESKRAPRRHPDAVAGLGWATGPGPGLFYEVTGEDPDDVRERIHAGLDTGGGLRDWELPDRETRVETVPAEPDRYATAVVIAAYGESEPVL
ncbi:pyruvoyl-dependent arginine decarboxylase subunit alpha [Halorubrum sp. GN11_10-6_MGM]|uniref:pyruvoyl-dependent arginine decarboxylase n=1 Tax=Halorubrum sp. GN11_10-6_MGM TaxID=2518112 RepID=UPI0010F8869D|nr:pyruvoyl-dependent arginine decarboxylase [Halorubrum sp. GN11_10-6_MGM]TKX73857.1 pyruvoyl-dependent arginine decarboxylase subunit alpha [Halorubrum sp. GN11_10-6_MGM]